MKESLTPAKPVIMATVITALVGAIVVLFSHFTTKATYEKEIEKLKLEHTKKLHKQAKPYEKQENTSKNKNKSQIHQFTHCIQVVMEESRKNNKPATAEEAKKVCVELRASDNSKHDTLTKHQDD